MSNFLIFKAAFNNSATPAIGTYTAEGAAAQFNRNTSISPDYYLYNTADDTAVQWFVPTAETTDFEFVADILTRNWTNRVTYFIIADSTGTTRLRMWSRYDNWLFENSDSDNTSGTEYIGAVSPTTSGGFGVFHQFRVRVRKLTAASSSVEVYVDGTLKLTATAGAALITCAKIGFVGGVNTYGPGIDAGVKNAYVYDLSGGDVIDRGVLSNAFTRFISWMKSKFALKSDIPTVNNGTLTIQKNGVNVQTFTANQSTAATANITVPTAVSELANDSGYLTSSSNLDASKLTSGTVDIARLPQGALERLVKVANEAARYALTTADVQLGDTVQQLDTGIMYVVTDTDHLDSAAGYTEYTAGTAASVPWSGVTGKPTFAAVATSGAYSDLTGTPTIPTVNNATLTIQRNGTTVDTFTANSSTDKTVNITVPTKTSDLTNDSGFITSDNTKIPLTGTSALAGNIVPSANDTYSLGNSEYAFQSITLGTLILYNDNALYFRDVNNAKAGMILGYAALLPSVDSTYALGSSDFKWKSATISGTVTCQSVVQTSDYRLKDEIELIPDEILDAWENLEPKQYKYKSDLETDKDTAQVHYGWIAQEVESVIKGDKKGEIKNGLWLHEEWEEQKEVSHEETYTEEVETKSGEKQTVTKTRKVIDTPYKAKGDSYSLRYTECLVVECKYLRRCIARLTARIEQLEKGKEQEASK